MKIEDGTSKCTYCGKVFIQAPGVGQKRKYCSKECCKKATKERYAKKPKEADHLSIDEVVKLTKKHGISYGKLVERSHIK